MVKLSENVNLLNELLLLFLAHRPKVQFFPDHYLPVTLSLDLTHFAKGTYNLSIVQQALNSPLPMSESFS